MADFDLRSALRSGLVIPAHPLALDASRRLDERRQRALSRYYIAAGAGGLAANEGDTGVKTKRPTRVAQVRQRGRIAHGRDAIPHGLESLHRPLIGVDVLETQVLWPA